MNGLAGRGNFVGLVDCQQRTLKRLHANEAIRKEATVLAVAASAGFVAIPRAFLSGVVVARGRLWLCVHARVTQQRSVAGLIDPLRTYNVDRFPSQPSLTSASRGSVTKWSPLTT